MKSSVQWSLSLGAIALITVGVPSGFLYRQATRIPPTLQDTFSRSEPEQRRAALNQGAFTTVRKLAAPVPLADGSTAAQLTASELNAFFAHSLALNIEESNTTTVLLGTQIELNAEMLKSVALIDLSQVTESTLERSGRLSLLRRLLKLPGLRHQTIAIAVEGKPIVRDRTLVIDNPVISIGEIQLTTTEAVPWLGVSQEILQERLDQEWRGLPIELEKVEIIAQGNSTVLQLVGGLTAW